MNNSYKCMTYTKFNDEDLTFDITANEIFESVQSIFNFYSNHYYNKFNEYFKSFSNSVLEYLQKQKPDTKPRLKDIFVLLDEVLIKMANSSGENKKYNQKNLKSSNRVLQEWKTFRDIFSTNNFIKELDEKYFNDYKLVLIQKSFEDMYGYKMIPNIVKYEEKTIKNINLTATFSDLNNNNFLVSVFKKIDVSIEEIKNAYALFKKNNNKSILSSLTKEINKKINIIADDFNKLYFVDNERYSFEIDLESERIFFNLFRGNKNSSLSLDSQSTGFKWFFNLYFNLLANNELNPGDIIIMDEPATNLHVSGQSELRKFLKEFAIRNDLTIIIATHSPFLIDIDNLDEIRVVSIKDNIASISNDFSAINPSDPDSLKPIKEALTIHNHIILDPDKIVVFVEGITDYNYLNAFKSLNDRYSDLVFVPIQGVGKNDEQQINIIKELRKIRKNKRVLLVDGDKAGQSIKKLNAKKSSDLEIITLTEINEEFVEIENLFSLDDQVKYGIYKGENDYIKSSSKSALMKTFIKDYIFDDETKENFVKVFDRLIN